MKIDQAATVPSLKEFGTRLQKGVQCFFHCLKGEDTDTVTLSKNAAPEVAQSAKTITLDASKEFWPKLWKGLSRVVDVILTVDFFRWIFHK